jgi:hypothetical protein
VGLATRGLGSFVGVHAAPPLFVENKDVERNRGQTPARCWLSKVGGSEVTGVWNRLRLCLRIRARDDDDALSRKAGSMM